jgi:hypothetical protein
MMEHEKMERLPLEELLKHPYFKPSNRFWRSHAARLLRLQTDAEIKAHIWCKKPLLDEHFDEAERMRAASCVRAKELKLRDEDWPYVPPPASCPSVGYTIGRWWASTRMESQGGIWWHEIIDLRNDKRYFVRGKSGKYREWQGGDEKRRDADGYGEGDWRDPVKPKTIQKTVRECVYETYAVIDALPPTSWPWTIGEYLGMSSFEGMCLVIDRPKE